jgi:hypothetical protein
MKHEFKVLDNKTPSTDRRFKVKVEWLDAKLCSLELVAATISAHGAILSLHGMVLRKQL